MKVLNYGSLNIDYVYGVDQFVKEGETKASHSFHVYAGGKGLNQSVALARAGLAVYHAGKIGREGAFLKTLLEEANVNTRHIAAYDGANGHAVIQIDGGGRNCILLHGGSNQQITRDEIDRALADFGKGDLLLLQNEINEIGYVIDRAYEKSMAIAINPAPMNEKVLGYPLEKVSVLMVNETEGQGLSGETDTAKIMDKLSSAYPQAAVLMTLGEKGSLCRYQGKSYKGAACKVKAVDTTSAGDTFCGYFLKVFLSGGGAEKALDTAAKAAAICVSRHGAAQSIPYANEVFGACILVV